MCNSVMLGNELKGWEKRSKSPAGMVGLWVRLLGGYSVCVGRQNQNGDVLG